MLIKGAGKNEISENGLFVRTKPHKRQGVRDLFNYSLDFTSKNIQIFHDFLLCGGDFFFFVLISFVQENSATVLLFETRHQRRPNHLEDKLVSLQTGWKKWDKQ